MSTEIIKLLWEIVAILIVIGYGIFVFLGKASIEGFIVIATYIIKKRLDLEELKNGGDK